MLLIICASLLGLQNTWVLLNFSRLGTAAITPCTAQGYFSQEPLVEHRIGDQFVGDSADRANTMPRLVLYSTIDNRFLVSHLMKLQLALKRVGLAPETMSVILVGPTASDLEAVAHHLSKAVEAPIQYSIHVAEQTLPRSSQLLYLSEEGFVQFTSNSPSPCLLQSIMSSIVLTEGDR